LSPTADENVLCFLRTDLPDEWIVELAAVKIQEEAFWNCLEGVPCHWRIRRTVEKDPLYKQVIPYVIVQTFGGECTACYRRKGTEKRLHDLWSVGIGGHINDCDCNGDDTSLQTIVNRGMAREVDEEVRLLPPDITAVFHGIINEEKTPVGLVHLGLVYRILLSDTTGFKPGSELNAFRWMETDRLFEQRLELWSRLALRLIDEEWD